MTKAPSVSGEGLSVVGRQTGRVKMEELALWVQVAAVLAALVAAVAAVWVGARDRRNAQRIADEDRRHAQRIAEDDRRAALRQSRLMFELDAALRLAANQRRGGSTDKDERARMGTEAAVLTGFLGPELLPHLTSELNPETDEELRRYMADPGTEEWKRRATEAHLAMLRVVRDLRAETEA
ncbi:hypothetical protein EDF19_0155 [Curtobacterium sp. PhB115]|nr:hypothetical protein EDF19_0155 [Curtobacterium sp. PhB115]